MAVTPRWVISGWAQEPTSTSQDLLEGIIQNVIGRTIEVAHEEVRRNTGIDLLRRGYARRSYDPAPADASEATRHGKLATGRRSWLRNPPSCEMPI